MSLTDRQKKKAVWIVSCDMGCPQNDDLTARCDAITACAVEDLPPSASGVDIKQFALDVRPA